MSTTTLYEMESPYLKAIQQIPGKTPGEKYKTLNLIARKLIDNVIDIDGNGTKNVEVKSTAELPECLVPIVSLEVAKILHQPDGIVAALKSDDAFINDRALKVKWFFDGSNKDITNSQYFKNHIFPYVSLTVRLEIIKKLVKYLMLSNSQSIAEEFYNELKQQYGEDIVRSLCFACGENFIRETTNKWKEPLTVNELKIIYPRFPNYVIELLNDISFRYIEFLPNLLKNHANEFVDIINKHQDYSSNLKLTNKKSELLFKNARNGLLKNPKLFIAVVNLKFITTKLTKSEFHQFYKQLFPDKYEDFCFTKFYDYLKYYTKEEKLNLLLSTFENVYGISLLDCIDLITPDLLKLLNPEQRIKIAKIKLEKLDKSYKPIDTKHSWICYLSINESIPLIKEKISKTSDSFLRGTYLYELIYTCSVNKDHDALLKVLDYTFMRHKNEQNNVILNFLERLRDNFDVKNLSKEHLVIVNQFIQFLNINYKLSRYIGSSLICDLIYSKFIRNEEIGELIKLYLEVNDSSELNILQDYPVYERKCLDEIIKQICLNENINDSPRTVCNLLKSMYNFNERNAKAKIILEKFTIKNYPSLFEAVKLILKPNNDEEYKYSSWERHIILKHLEKEENDIFLTLFDKSNSIEKIEFDNSNIIKLLQKSPEKIIQNWNECLEKCRDKIKYHNFPRRFLCYARWHQNLPIMFANECLKQLENKENDDVHENLYVLAILYDGLSYEKLFTPFIPESKILDLTNSKTKKEYTFNCSILWSMNIVNPPVSVDSILKFCQGDYVHEAINTLNNVGRRMPVNKVTEFSKTLVNHKISVKKHAIRLFCQVASHQQIQEMMLYLWNKEKHLSIREIIYKYISELFIKEPSIQSWSLIKKCINDVKTEDHYWSHIFNINQVSNNFLEQYILELFKTIERIEETEDDFRCRESQMYVARILRSINQSFLCSEELYQYIVKNYFVNLSRPEYFLSDNIQIHVINQCFIQAGDKLESRLIFLTDLILKIVKTNWNIPYEFNSNLLPVNLWISKLIILISNMKFNHVKIKIAKVLLEALLTVLKPEQLGTCYLDLVYIGVFNDDQCSIDEIINKLVQLLPSIIQIYSSELMSKIVEHFSKPLQMFLNTKKDAKVLDVIEKLISNDDKNVLFFASTLLMQSLDLNADERYSKIIGYLKMSKYPAVTIPITDKLNTQYANIEFDKLPLSTTKIIH